MPVATRYVPVAGFDGDSGDGIRRFGFNIASLSIGECPQPSGAHFRGVKALMLAVLEDGIASYLGGHERRRSEAERWIASSGDTSPFGFAVICEALGLQPAAVRQVLKRLRAARVAQGAQRRAFRRLRPNVRRDHRAAVR